MTKKTLPSILLLALFATPLLARYIVITTDGTRYRAKQRWTIKNGKAMVALENGTVLQMDPKMIDVARSDEANRSGLGDAKLLAVSGAPVAVQEPASASTLGDMSRSRRKRAGATVPPPVATSQQVPASAVPLRPAEDALISKFRSAFDNIGVFESKVESAGDKKLKIVLATDNETQVFNAISATAYIFANAREASESGTRQVNLTMRTISGQAAGSFEMTRADAEALASKKILPVAYFLNNVIF